MNKREIALILACMIGLFALGGIIGSSISLGSNDTITTNCSVVWCNSSGLTYTIIVDDIAYTAMSHVILCSLNSMVTCYYRPSNVTATLSLSDPIHYSNSMIALLLISIIVLIATGFTCVCLIGTYVRPF